MYDPEQGISKYFEIARERYRILLKRRAGEPKPWTTDPVFQAHRFCNVFREDDRTTSWFRENIRSPINEIYAINPEIILLSIVAFRWFNRIETWEAILGSGVELEEIFGSWDEDWIRGELFDHAKPPYVTGAFIIKTPNGKNKVEGVLWCISEFRKMMKEGKFNHILSGTSSHESAQRLLETAPFLGRFMAYQIIADARYTKLLENAEDISSWAQPGPGSTRGIGRVFYGEVDKFRYGSINEEKQVIAHMQELMKRSKDSKYWPSEWPQWEMQVVQNWCCETDKNFRCIEGGKMKRKYDARG